MAITDSGVPSTDPHTTLSTLLTNNVDSVGGWTPVVNTGWLEYKKQKTYQIAITPLYAETDPAQLTGGTSTTSAKRSSAYYTIHLYHPSRTSLWSLYREVLEVLNNESLTMPSAGINDYYFIKVTASQEVRPVDFYDESCGIDRESSDHTGFQAEITVILRWNE